MTEEDLLYSEAMAWAEAEAQAEADFAFELSLEFDDDMFESAAQQRAYRG